MVSPEELTLALGGRVCPPLPPSPSASPRLSQSGDCNANGGCSRAERLSRFENTSGRRKKEKTRNRHWWRRGERILNQLLNVCRGAEFSAGVGRGDRGPGSPGGWPRWGSVRPVTPAEETVWRTEKGENRGSEKGMQGNSNWGKSWSGAGECEERLIPGSKAGAEKRKSCPRLPKPPCFRQSCSAVAGNHTGGFD